MYDGMHFNACLRSLAAYLDIFGLIFLTSLDVITHPWGYLVCLGKAIARTDSFASMRMLIETDVLLFIEKEIILRIEELGYKVIIREVGSVSQIIQQVQQVSISQAEDTDSNKDVIGFEDIEDNMDPYAGNERGEQGSPIGQQATMEDSHQIAGQLNSNLNFETRNEGTVCAMPASSINSTTRTKTANLSNDEGSVEVIKKYTYLEALRLEGKKQQDDEVEESLQEPPGFEVSAHNKKAGMNDCAIIHQCKPCGMECNTREDTDAVGLGNISRSTKLPVKSSQNIHSQDHIGRNSKSKCTQEKSEDSICKIAKEAEEIGKALGVTVIQHEKTTLRRDPQRSREDTKGKQQVGAAKCKGKKSAARKLC